MLIKGNSCGFAPLDGASVPLPDKGAGLVESSGRDFDSKWAESEAPVMCRE